MQDNVQLNGLARQIEWQHRSHREFLAALHGNLGESANQICCLPVVVEFRGQLGIEEDPATAAERISEVIDLKRRSRQLASVLHPPGEDVQASIDRACRSATVVEINGAEAN